MCNYSKIVKPLNALLLGHPTHKKVRKTKEATLWTLGIEQQTAFDTIIEKLTSPPVLAYTDYTNPFLLNIDASGDEMVLVLSFIRSRMALSELSLTPVVVCLQANAVIQLTN